MLLRSLVVLLIPGTVCAGDWPQWRGPHRDAVSNESGFLTSWETAPPAEAWHTSGIGDGYSSVVVSNGKVFSTGRIDDHVLCIALDENTGRQVWSTNVGTTSRNVMSTPTAHDGLVYALDPDGELVCLAADDGRIIWQRSFVDDFGGRMMSGRGYGESPLVDGDRLICTPGGADAMLVALDRRTGDVVWKSVIPDIGDKGRDGAAFSSVVVSHGAGVRQLVQLTGRGLVGLDAETGRFLWGYNDISNQTANIPTPIVVDDYVFAANGYHSGAVLLKLEKSAGGTGVETREVYRLRGNRFQNHHGGYVRIGDYVFGGHGSNNGLPTCLEWKTGDIAWKSRGPGTGSAAVVAADAHLYFRYQNGVVALVAASHDDYELNGTFEVPGTGGDGWSHPVISNGRLFLREKNDLWVYDLTRQSDGSKPPMPSPTPFDDPQLAALQRLQVRVEPLHPGTAHGDGRPDRNRIGLFVEDDPGDDTEPPMLVTLSGQHVTAAGTITNNVIAQLRRVNSDCVLSLAGTSVNDAELEQIASLKNLVGLNLEFCRAVTDAGIARLKAARRLETLVLSGTAVTNAALRSLVDLPGLRGLDLEVCNGVTDAGCEWIGRMGGLRELNLKKTGFEPDRISGDGLKQLSELAHLRSLNLYGNSLDNDGLAQLRTLAKLEQLDLSLNAVTDTGLSHLKPLKNLRRLDLLYSEGFAGPMITNAGLGAIAKLKTLRSLNLVGAKITDEGIDPLFNLSQLVRLQITNSKLTAGGIGRLQHALPRCEVVSSIEP